MFMSKIGLQLMLKKTDTIEIGKNVLKAEINGLSALYNTIDSEFEKAVDLILNTKGRIIVSGMGKSGHIAKKIAATLSSTGTPAYFVHPAEASHGDLGMISQEDTCLVISKSGRTSELTDLIAYTRRFQIKLIGITQNMSSPLSQQSDFVLALPDISEACSIGRAPTTSTTCALVLGDCLSIATMRLRRFDDRNFQMLHPGGNLGAKLIPVSKIMHSGVRLPLVSPNSNLEEVLSEMTSKGLGTAILVNDQKKLMGIITDGDIRRNLLNSKGKIASELAISTPHTINKNELMESALKILNFNDVNVLIVVDDQQHVEGLLHVQDCLRIGAM